MTALEAINEVRSRAGMPLLDIASQDEFRLRCRNERRVELAFEEHRYWDVRRWGILGETDRTVTGKANNNTGVQWQNPGWEQ